MIGLELCRNSQKHLFLHQLTHNMTTDCSWNYHEQSFVIYILWVSWCKNKCFWKRFNVLIFQKKKKKLGILWEPSGIRRFGLREVHCFRVGFIYFLAIDNQGHLDISKSLVSILQCMQVLWFICLPSFWKTFVLVPYY